MSFVGMLVALPPCAGSLSLVVGVVGVVAPVVAPVVLLFVAESWVVFCNVCS